MEATIPTTPGEQKAGVYVYCIIESEEPRTFGKIGIGGRNDEVFTVHYRDLAAVVSHAALQVYDPTRENALNHEHVNEVVMVDNGFTPVPMSFGTLFKTEEDTVEFLKDTYDVLRDVLHLIKPSKVEELRSTVARGIERRRLGLELEARIGELERANREIVDLNTSLQRRVDEATAELKERYDQLKELDRLKSQFLSIASHELKTPITAMSGFLQVALKRLRRIAEGLDDQQVADGLRGVSDQLDVVYRQTGKLARLIDELLDVSRIQTGRIEFRYADVDIAELADEVAARMQLTTAAHQITVKRNTSAVVIADRDHLEQVLNNLVTNAIKYAPSGGAITIDVRPDDGGMRLSVTDEGIGIQQEELDAIFGLFYRSPDRAARDAAGMGLGLYISKEIITRHGGRIWAESAAEQGSTFHVVLPRVQAGAVQPEPAVATPARV